MDYNKGTTKLISGICISIVSFVYIYNKMKAKYKTKNLIFSNIENTQYLILAKKIHNYSKEMTINKLYKFIINDKFIDLPIESFIYEYENIKFTFYPLLEKEDLLGYTIEYNTNNMSELDSFINYLFTK